MGYYMEVPKPTAKADQLIRLYGATPIEAPKLITDIPEGKAAVVVVENGLFDAAGYAYNQRELDAFTYPGDPRPRTWLLIDKDKVAQNILENHGVDISELK